MSKCVFQFFSMPILYVFFLGMGKELPSICCCLQTRTWHDLYTIRQNCQTWRRRTNHWQDTENKFKPVVSDIQLNSLRSEKVCPFSRISRTDIPIVSISWNRKAICSSFIYGRGFFAVFPQSAPTLVSEKVSFGKILSEFW